MYLRIIFFRLEGKNLETKQGSVPSQIFLRRDETDWSYDSDMSEEVTGSDLGLDY